MKTETVKGFRDFTGEDSEKREEIRKILVETFENYGFEPAETPVVEYEEFVKGENSNDEAVSDIFRLKDRGNRRLALRYEFTFQLKRLMKNRKLPFKRYEIGPVFRDEPVSSNRFRQFTQCDLDTVGSTIRDEAETLAVAKKALERLGIDFVIYFNNRKLLNEIMEKEKIPQANREIVIREIDKLDKMPEKEILNSLKRYKAGKILEIFKKPEKYFEKYDSYSEIKELKEYCKFYGLEKELKFLPGLARGLSYYNGSVFEIKTKEMKETITAGGSYSFSGVQCTGISLGLERLSILAKIKSEQEKIIVLSLGQDEEAIKFIEKMRNSGSKCILFSGKPTKALDYANSKGIKKVYFVGNEEVKKGKAKLKDLDSGKEKYVSLKKV